MRMFIVFDVGKLWGEVGDFFLRGWGYGFGNLVDWFLARVLEKLNGFLIEKFVGLIVVR